MAPKAKNIAALTAVEPQLLGIDSIPFETLQAEVERRIKAQTDEAAALESNRVAALKAQHEALNTAYQTSMGALADFITGLSDGDRVTLGLKVEVSRQPKGSTEKALRAYLATLTPGSRFTTAFLLEEVVPDASAATVRSALAAIGIEPNGKGKAAHYLVPPVQLPLISETSNDSAPVVPAEVSPAGEPAAEAGTEGAPASN